ncbi:MAG: hypothetical protein AAF662_02315 [Pseudomonadota bacterium]
MNVRLAGIELPSEIQWVDEFAGHGVGQIIEPTLTGALIVEETAQVNGRPITLESNASAWVDRSTVELLSGLAATPLASGSTLTLEWGDGRTFDVVFDHSRGAPFSAEEVRRLAAGAQTPTHKYLITINLLTA